MAGFLRTEGYLWTKNILSVIIAIGLIIIFVVECIVATKLLRNKNKKATIHRNHVRKEMLLILLPLFIYIGYFLSIFVTILDDFQLTNIPCIVWSQIGPVSWLIAKCILYLLLILRLHTVYFNTVFAYNTKLLWSIAIIVILQAIIMCYLTPTNTRVEISYHNGERICEAIVDIFILGGSVLIDMSVSFFTLYLFLRPLKKCLVFAQKHMEFDNEDNEVYALMIKLSSLTTVMVFTTFIVFLIVGLFDVISVATIDIMINAICIALFNNTYDVYFHKFCYGAIICTQKMTANCCCCQSNGGVDHLKIKRVYSGSSSTTPASPTSASPTSGTSSNVTSEPYEL